MNTELEPPGGADPETLGGAVRRRRRACGSPLPTLLLGIALAMLAACAAPTRPTLPPSPEADAARSAEAQGDWPLAATSWEAAAEAAGPSAKATYWLNAADAWLQTDNREAVERALDSAGILARGSPEEVRAALARAELALGVGDVDMAEFFLDAARQNLPSSLRDRYEADTRQLEALRTDPASVALASARESLGELDPYTTAAGLSMLRTLETVPADRLAREAVADTSLAPWAALSISIRDALINREDVEKAADRWRREHPGHPVDTTAYMELGWQYGQYFAPPARVAVLLPNEGGLATAGAAVRDGIMAAYLDHPGESELTFMGVSDDPASVLAAYRTAVSGNYQWVIGPLRRETVNVLMAPDPGALPTDSVPTLALNWPETPDGVPETPARSDLYGLTLSQRDEARAAAGKMLDLGYRRVIVMRVDDAWGERSETAFVDAFLDGGGRIMAVERFNPAEADHSARLTSMLRIEDSRQRKQRLQSALNVPLEFEPTRRDDFDAIFMAVEPGMARQLKPQLRYYDAGDVPVFATSRVFTGEINPGQDQDLNGIAFPTTAWSVGRWEDTPAEHLSSLRNGNFGALYALGRDSWNVLPWLGLMARNPAFRFPGNVGGLSVRPDGRLARDPIWARFERGRPVPLPEPERRLSLAQ